jgi:hypothetical protein
MNIIKNKKKIAIIGRGTAGSLAASHFSHHTSDEIFWYYDSNLQSQSVGEGSTLPFPESLHSNLGLKFSDLKEIDGVPKTGIHKIGWGGSGNFLHSFPVGTYGMHFNAVKFQDYVYKKIYSKVTAIDQNILNPLDIDADYIIDCSGAKFSKDKFNAADSMVVNASYITSCYWDYPKFTNTLTIARPYGWVFGIPLQNRCSIGYVYNKDINSLKEIKEDVKVIFEKYNLTPSNDVKSLSFQNYYRKENFTNQVSHNGNASFFLEPLEATSTGVMDGINRHTYDIIYDNLSVDTANAYYNHNFIGLQIMILLHYLSGSKFSTPFWDSAYQKAEKFLINNIPKTHFLEIYNYSKSLIKSNTFHINSTIPELGQWGVTNYNINLSGLDLYKKIDKLLNI